MSWLGCLQAAADWLADVLDPDTPVENGDQRHRRGAQLRTPRSHDPRRAYREYVRQLKAWERALRDPPGPRFWPGSGPDCCGWTVRQAEQHALFLAATRGGKTQEIVRILRSAITQGWRCVVVDAKGEYTQWLIPSGLAALLAPWDRRSIVYLPGVDVRTRSDARDLAAALLPERVEGRDPFWVTTSRNILTGIVLHEMSAGRPWGWDAVWRWIVNGPGYAVARFLTADETKPAADALAKAQGQKSMSAADIWKTVSAYLSDLSDLAAAWPAGEAAGRITWSARAWVRGEGPRVLILPLPSEHRSLGRANARLALMAIARAVLALPEDPGRRILLVLDEFADLGEMEPVAELLRKGAAKGVAVMLGVQDLGSVRKAWGRDQAESILSACGSLFVGRLGDPELAVYAARALAGRREVEERIPTATHHTGRSGGTSRGEQVRVAEEWVIRPEELINMQSVPGYVAAYVRVAGWPQVVHLAWEIAPLPQLAPAVEEAEWVTRPLTLRGQPPSAEEFQDAPSERMWDREEPPHRPLLEPHMTPAAALPPDAPPGDERPRGWLGRGR